MSIRLIAIDMDGTLLSTKNEVSLKTREMLRKAKEKGINIVISTGRIYTSARYYAKLLGINAPIISCNGAFVVDHITEEVIYENPIEIKDCIRAIKILEDKNIYFHYYGKKDFFVGNLNNSYLYYYKRGGIKNLENQINIKVIENHIEFLQKERPSIYKLFILEEDSNKLMELKKIFSEDKNLEISASSSNNMEIMNKNVSKGEALKRLSEKFNINREEVAAIGDSFNDASMLQFAGFPIAMGNSEKYIKDMAKFVTDTNDNDGVAKAIEKLLSL